MIDFVILKNGKPEFAVECKSGPRTLSRNIRYFAERTPIPRYYQVYRQAEGDETEWPEAKARIMPFVRFCE